MNKPRKMNISVMRQLVEQTHINKEESFYMSKDFGFTKGTSGMLHVLLENNAYSPFVVEDYRIGVVLKGEIDVTINLINYHVKPNSIIYLGYGSIVQANRVSPDLTVMGFLISQEMIARMFGEKKPDLLNGATRHYIKPCNETDIQVIGSINKTAWQLANSTHYSESTMCALLNAVLWHYDSMFNEEVHGKLLSPGTNHNRDVFNNFIALVNLNADKERGIAFYADKLCFSPRYLSTLVSQESGQTAKYWIDQATITRAKVLLHHTTKSVSQISDELHFPNDSFFCKYFRRIEGCSPSEYREGKAHLL